MKRRVLAGCIAALATATPAIAVGLGPLSASGLTVSDRKGFFLNLYNPYDIPTAFKLVAIGWDDETVQTRVLITALQPTLSSQGQRRILIIDTELVPGEIHRFRVCAERSDPNGEALIHARVCSKLTAQRVL